MRVEESEVAERQRRSVTGLRHFVHGSRCSSPVPAFTFFDTRDWDFLPLLYSADETPEASLPFLSGLHSNCDESTGILPFSSFDKTVLSFRALFSLESLPPLTPSFSSVAPLLFAVLALLMRSVLLLALEADKSTNLDLQKEPHYIFCSIEKS